MGINTATMQFRDDLVSLVNNSGLPICNVEIVMSDVLSAVRVKLRKVIELEQARLSNQEEIIKEEKSEQSISK